MKKSYLALGLVAAVAMSSCSNDEPMPNNGNGNQNLAQGYEPVKLSMTTSTADVEVSGARTRGTGTVGSMDPNQNLWQYEDIYVLMTSTQTRKHYPYWQTDPTWGFTSALGNGPFLFDQFDGSFWARPSDSNKKGNVSVSVLDYTIDRNEWWWGGSIDRFYPLSGGSHFFAYYIDDAVADSVDVDREYKEKKTDEELKLSGRESSHAYPKLNLNNETKDAYSVKFDLDGSQDLMAGYAPIPADGYAAQDKGFSARSARQGVVPQISMKHLLSRLTFEVVKGGENFDRVTLKGIKVESKDKGDMVVAINPNFEVEDPDYDPWENVGKITWTEGEGSTEAFALKQIADKYIVDENGVAGTYTVGEDNYDVYYNIYDGLYANVKQTEKVEVERQDSWFAEGNFIAETKITVDGVEYTVEEDDAEGVKSYFYTKTTYVKTAIYENQVEGLIKTSSMTAGKAKLVDFADVDLKNFELKEKESQAVGEAMFVAPGETSYTLTLEMAYLVRDGEAEELANLEQAVAAAAADVYATERALNVAEAIAAKRVEAQTAAKSAYDEAANELARLEAAVSTAKTAMDQAEDALTVARETNGDVAAAQAKFDEEEGKYKDAQKAVEDYKNNTYTPAEQALKAANDAVDAANAAVKTAAEDLADAQAAELIAKDNLAKFEPVVEEMTQDLTVKLPQGEFLAGHSYNIRVTIYGYEPAEVEVLLTPWLDGGHFDVGGDDDDVENGDYYPNGNHEDNEDDVVEDGE
ncbi:MAG: hypothetical protein U0L52_00575 [Bacteroidaceae bacterium]|nr:hypothetical protein [Bacteroidaceae bacterium]